MSIKLSNRILSDVGTRHGASALLASVILVIMAGFLTGCSDELPGLDSAARPGERISLSTGVELPEMWSEGNTRAMGEAPTPEELMNSLNVNVFVFDKAGVMLQFIGPEDIDVVGLDEAQKKVNFRVNNIYSSDQKRILHFVVTSAPDLHKLTGGEYIQAMASETTAMPALVVGGDTDAYWGKKTLPQITKDLHIDVKLIRNFVKLSVRSSADESAFRLLGYTVVNRPSCGTIAPYNHRDHLFADFLDPETDALLDYDHIIEKGYRGVNPAGSDRDMTVTTAAEVEAELENSEAALASGSAETPVYIYERTQSSIQSAGSGVQPTYAIVSGEYKGKKTYYKIDIGKDRDGKFGYYDLLRNFQYTVDITEVGGEGAPSVQDAMNGAAHNNLSTSIVTRDLFSIGYSGEKIEVSTTRVVFTEQTADYELRFRYTMGKGQTFDPSKLKVYDLADESVEYDMSGVTTASSKTVNLAGDVITAASLVKGTNDWYVLRVSSKAMPADSRRLEQNIRVYYNGGNAGLGRTVTFMMRRPWEFSAVSATSPGTALSAEFTLSFTLPAGLPKSIFPLTLTFESDRHNIVARNGSDLYVATGKSGFADAGTDEVIYYEQRLEWEQYSHPDGTEGGPMTAPFRMNTTSAEDASPTFRLRLANAGPRYLTPQILTVTRH